MSTLDKHKREQDRLRYTNKYIQGYVWHSLGCSSPAPILCSDIASAPYSRKEMRRNEETHEGTQDYDEALEPKQRGNPSSTQRIHESATVSN
eukprot:1151034-Pelagomonas_calceolata.AAC.2